MAAQPQLKSRRRLSRERVAAAALKLLDQEGMSALTMRRVADELGVGTMTLYTYFRTKQELLDAVVDLAVGEPTEVAQTGSWRERLEALLQASREKLVRHPALVALRVQQPVLQPSALRMTEAAMAILTEAGFPKDEAAKAFRLLFTYSLGYAAFSPPTAAAEAQRAAGAALAALPADEYPTLGNASQELLQAMGGDKTYEYGLARILDGLQSRLETLARKDR